MLRGIIVVLVVQLFSFSAIAQLTFTPPVPVYSDAGVETDDDFAAGLGVSEDSTFVIMWVRRAEPISPDPYYHYSVLATRSTDAGLNWSTPTLVALEASLSRFAFSDQNFKVTTDNDGNWMTSWLSPDSVNPDSDIVFSRSTDNGVSWSSAITLNSNATTDSRNDSRPFIHFSNGNWVCLWQSYSLEALGDELGVDVDILYSVSTDTGVSWSNQAPLNHDAMVDQENDLTPKVTSDELGKWLATWEREATYLDPYDNPVQYKSYTMTAWSMDEGVNWDNSEVFSQNPDDHLYHLDQAVLSDGRGGWIVGDSSYLTQPEFTSPDIKIHRTYDNGNSWANGKLFPSTDYIFDVDRALALSDDGGSTILGVYDEVDEENVSRVKARHSVDGGLTWKGTTILATTDIPADASMDRSMDVNTSSQFDLRNGVYTRQNSSNLRSVSFPDVYHDAKVATDGSGNWIVVWNLSRMADSEVVFTRISQQPIDGIYRIYVDFNYAGQVRTGGYEQPFNTMAEAIAGVATNGVAWIRPGSSSEALSINKAMTIEAIDGLVTIGN